MNAASGQRFEAREKAKRASGDVDAIAKYERQKERSRRRAGEIASERGNGRAVGRHESEPPPYTEKDARDFAERVEEQGCSASDEQTGHRGEMEARTKATMSNPIFFTKDGDEPFAKVNTRGGSADARSTRGLRIADLLNAEDDEKDERSLREMEETPRMRKLRLGRKKAKLETRLRKVEVEMVAAEQKLEALQWMAELEKGPKRS